MPARLGLNPTHQLLANFAGSSKGLFYAGIEAPSITRWLDPGSGKAFIAAADFAAGGAGGTGTTDLIETRGCDWAGGRRASRIPSVGRLLRRASFICMAAIRVD